MRRIANVATVLKKKRLLFRYIKYIVINKLKRYIKLSAEFHYINMNLLSMSILGCMMYCRHTPQNFRLLRDSNRGGEIRFEFRIRNRIP